MEHPDENSKDEGKTTCSVHGHVGCTCQKGCNHDSARGGGPWPSSCTTTKTFNGQEISSSLVSAACEWNGKDCPSFGFRATSSNQYVSKFINPGRWSFTGPVPAGLQAGESNTESEPCAHEEPSAHEGIGRLFAVCDFELIPFPVVITQSEGGTVECNKESVDYLDCNITYKITPAEGYGIYYVQYGNGAIRNGEKQIERTYTKDGSGEGEWRVDPRPSKGYMEVSTAFKPAYYFDYSNPTPCDCTSPWINVVFKRYDKSAPYDVVIKKKVEEEGGDARDDQWWPDEVEEIENGGTPQMWRVEYKMKAPFGMNIKEGMDKTLKATVKMVYTDAFYENEQTEEHELSTGRLLVKCIVQMESMTEEPEYHLSMYMAEADLIGTLGGYVRSCEVTVDFKYEMSDAEEMGVYPPGIQAECRYWFSYWDDHYKHFVYVWRINGESEQIINGRRYKFVGLVNGNDESRRYAGMHGTNSNEISTWFDHGASEYDKVGAFWAGGLLMYDSESGKLMYKMEE